MKDDYLQALFPDSFKAFGVELLPFSVGHSLLLSRFEVKFPDDKDFDEHDIVKLVHICSRNHVSNLADFGRFSVTRSCVIRWYRSVKYYCRNLDVLRNYFIHSIVGPSLLQSNKHEPSRAPLGEIIYVTFKREFGLSDSEIFDTPLALANYRMAVLSEGNGSVRFNPYTPEDRKEMLKEWQRFSNSV